MISTGRGTLADDEIDLLRRGLYYYIKTPEHGPTLVVDGDRIKDATSEMVDRVIFYLAKIIEDEVIQTQGVTVVFAVTADDAENKFSDRLGM